MGEAKVVRFREDVSLHGEPHEPVVRQLEQMLDDAKKGSLTGLVYAASFSDGRWAHGWECAAGNRHRLSSGLVVLMQRFGKALEED